MDDRADNCPLAPNAEQDDEDGDEIGDVCDFETDAQCGPGQLFEPIERAEVASGTSGACAGCSVSDPENAIDADPESFASLSAGQSAGSAFVEAKDTVSVYTGTRSVGAVVRNPGAEGYVNLIQSTRISTYLDDEEIEDSEAGGTLRVIPVTGDSSKLLLQLETQQSFDEARVSYSSAAQLSLDVFSICVGEP